MSTQFPLFINGQWIETSNTIENVNPSDTSDVIGHYAQASADEVEQAIVSARQGAKLWGAAPLETRYQVLMSIGNELIERSESLGELLSREEGKTRAEGMGEVVRSGQFFHYFAAEVHRQIDQRVDSVRPGVEVETRREPVGVVGVISPWNFPMATAVWKIAPALAFGNAVVFKPANLVPGSAWALTEIVSRQAALPAGSFNLIMGKGSTVGDQLVNSDKIDAVTFTGSLPVGRQVASATAANLVKCQLEMGSKNALIVAADADIEVAVNAAFIGAFSGTGQKCTASSRLIVDASLHDEFVARLKAKLEDTVVGPALDAGVEMGPVASEQQLSENLNWIEQGVKDGATLACGGQRLQLSKPGYYMSPALLIGTTNAMQINREELFAPIACVIKSNDYEHALTILNDTEFGLTAGIVTRSLATASDFKKRAESGCVMINLPTAGTDYHVPFGGRKHSSFGPREQGQYAREFYTIVKTIYLQP
ncbi:MAG: aldehyde dehydrogenase family protein [Gammaproteobacteria bacterium TMED95]|nr:aldehyde dehydrogenase family protein [Gammaproteobacteria bacterium]OUV20539.1 MAG: aldehyde dehydrogenase family protein [Gammaproteobacteria bacterium TMED95]